MTHSSIKQVIHRKRKAVHLGKKKKFKEIVMALLPARYSHTLHIFFIYAHTDQESSLTVTPQSQHCTGGREQWCSQQSDLTTEHVASFGKNPLLKNSQHQDHLKQIWIPWVTRAICKNRALASTCQNWEKVWLCIFMYILSQIMYGDTQQSAASHKNYHFLPVTTWTRWVILALILSPTSNFQNNLIFIGHVRPT